MCRNQIVKPKGEQEAMMRVEARDKGRKIKVMTKLGAFYNLH